MCFLVGGATLAGLEDSRLDRLFNRLQHTEDAAEAALVERLIWTIWNVYPDDDGEVERLMGDGAAALRRGAFDTAERLFGRVTEVAPQYAEGWNKRATVRFVRGNYVGSVADLRTVLALEPRHFGALSGLGLCLIRLGRPEEALQAFELALSVNPHLDGARAHARFLRDRLAGQAI